MNNVYSPDQPLRVSGGLVTGVLSPDGQTRIYKGVPYAAPPVGQDRWRPPKSVIPWEGVRPCDAFSSICPQSTTAYGDFQKEFYADPYPPMSEDCLYLNIWTPVQIPEGEKLPVMVYVHGGGNGSGWGHEKEFDGEIFARKGCILVTINYRLGVFGFFAHEDLAAEAGGCAGNYALMDQAAAFAWVHENISAFGGDPGRVTMCGQSAGAMDLTLLACAPSMKGLVRRAIYQSGGFLDMFAPVPLEKAMAEGKALTEALGKSVAQLRELDGQALFQAVSAAGIRVAGACVDGAFLPQGLDVLLEEGRYLDLDYMIGSNSGEFGGGFARGVTWLGEKQLELGRSPAWCYEFAHFIPGEDDPSSTCHGAFHTGECWYIFHTLDRCWRKPFFTRADYALSELMSDCWTSFVKTGDPNGPNVPRWEPYTPETRNIQVLDVKD